MPSSTSTTGQLRYRSVAIDCSLEKSVGSLRSPAQKLKGCKNYKEVVEKIIKSANPPLHPIDFITADPNKIQESSRKSFFQEQTDQPSGVRSPDESYQFDKATGLSNLGNFLNGEKAAVVQSQKGFIPFMRYVSL